MTMVCGFDLHRRQMMFDALEVDLGEEWRGWIWQPDREPFRRWLRGDVTRRAQGGRVALAVEGCTGWRYVVEEIESAGFEAHLNRPGFAGGSCTTEVRPGDPRSGGEDVPGPPP